MRLSSKQISIFDRKGYLVFRNLFSDLEVTILRQEASRIATLETECIIREGRSGAPKTIFHMHEADGPTSSAPYNSASRLPRVLFAAKQVLRGEELYTHHSKINIKAAIEEIVRPWH